MQDSNNVYVFNVPEREELDRPTARLIKEFDSIEGKSSSGNWLIADYCVELLSCIDLQVPKS